MTTRKRWERMEQFECIAEYQTRIDPRGMRVEDVASEDTDALIGAGLVDVRDGGARLTAYGALIINQWKKVDGALPDHPAFAGKEAHDEF